MKGVVQEYERAKARHDELKAQIESSGVKEMMSEEAIKDKQDELIQLWRKGHVVATATQIWALASH